MAMVTATAMAGSGRDDNGFAETYVVGNSDGDDGSGDGGIDGNGGQRQG